MVKGITILGLLALLLSCKSDKDASEHELGLVYNVLRDLDIENYEVYSMNLDGTNQRNITDLYNVEWTYYSYGNTLYFVSDRDACKRCFFLYKSDFNGENVQKVSDLQLADSWMSTRNDGKELIVKPKLFNESTFYVLDSSNGTVIHRLDTGLPYAADPLFVNDGEQIVFRGGSTVNKNMDGFNEELYIIDVDGNNLKQLTQYPEEETQASKYGYKAGAPRLHPTENYVTYQSIRNGKYSLYAVSLDGSKHWKLTENTQNEGWHDWSPDGKWLAIELFDNDQTQFHIGLMNWETKELKVLTDDTFVYQQAPNFIYKN
ncbi:TolB family protein [Flagellimonas zhangzhouensis]|uniref:TolB protein n=1 Tax=Flagellimonas zhangzhouensis TaxID=1073328 RepID=A0A1H2S6E0_9FLAO|nr:PD40 domain-containing protein [Allomuricauda zhangzhouensis]SDQ70788.1 TolB protein [Allomuricauda zhangzhouensis]SDW26744.1 TolB protein [Allomuricauda zhangzhouensis]